MRMFNENGQPRSPLDDIPDLEMVDAEKMKALEDRLRPKLEEARIRSIKDYHEGRERLRHVILD